MKLIIMLTKRSKQTAVLLTILLLAIACRTPEEVVYTPLPTNSVAIPTRAVETTDGTAVAAATVAGTDDVTPIATNNSEQPTAQATVTTLPTPTAAPCTPRTEWPSYTVKAGDTLGTIAQAAGSSIAELTAGNCLENPNLIEVGQTIYVPQEIALVPTPTSPTGWQSYTDPEFQVTFSYPANWSREQEEGVRFSGSDGFLVAIGLGSPHDLQQTAENEAAHHLLPYGANPAIETLTLKSGQEARLIVPTVANTNNLQAALIAPYTEPIDYNNVKLNYLMVVTDPAHIREIAQTVMMATTSTDIGIDLFTAEVVEEIANDGRRIRFEWQTRGATHGTLTSGTSERFLNWWNVGPADTLTADLGRTMFPNPIMTLHMFNNVTGQETIATVQLAWDCTYDYFFTPAPERCATQAAQETNAVYQPFEHGFMVWRPSENTATIYAFFDDGEVFLATDSWAEGDPESDPNFVPPDGLYQPVRGFGNVWRENEWVREQLGWATAEESAYTTRYQSEMRESIPGVSYLTRPDGELLKLVDTRWEIWPHHQLLQRLNATTIEPVLTAVLHNDTAAKLALTQLVTEGCTTETGLGGPPKCADGQSDGTPIDYFPLMGPGHGEPILPERLPEVMEFAVNRLYAIVKIPAAEYRSGSWPSGEYALLFETGSLPVTLLVDQGQIVRLNVGSETAAYELARLQGDVLWLTSTAEVQR